MQSVNRRICLRCRETSVALQKKGRTRGRGQSDREEVIRTKRTCVRDANHTGSKRLSLYVQARTKLQTAGSRTWMNRHFHRRRRRRIMAPSRGLAEICQPPRADRGRHRHRQDRDPADPGRGVFGGGRAGVPVGRQGRSFRAGRGGQPRRSSCMTPSPKRAETIGLTIIPIDAFPVTFWDLFGEQGHPVRTTLAEMGPLLLSRLMDLSEAQEGIMNIAFRVADEEGMPLLDLKDLQALLVWVGENRRPVAALWQCVAAIGGRDPAAAAGAGKPGRRSCSENRRWILRPDAQRS